MENAICKLFGIRYPIVQGGMVWISGAKLAAAVSQAGGLGLIGSGSMPAELLREHIRKAKTLTDYTFAAQSLFRDQDLLPGAHFPSAGASS